MNKNCRVFTIGALSLATGLALARPPHLEHFDVDQDGRLSRAEIESGAASRAQAIDSDGDGLISLEELQADHQRRHRMRMEKRLAAADANGDGQVGLGEFSAQMVDKMMSRDRDGDGLLSPADRPGPRGQRPR